MHTIEAYGLLGVIGAPKSFSLKECNDQDSHHEQEDVLSGDLYNLLGLVLDLWVVLDEELEHELLL